MKSGDQQSLERPREVRAKFPQHLPGMQMDAQRSLQCPAQGLIRETRHIQR